MNILPAAGLLAVIAFLPETFFRWKGRLAGKLLGQMEQKSPDLPETQIIRIDIDKCIWLLLHNLHNRLS
jgi:hypothetical protein